MVRFVEVNYATATPLPGPRTLNNGAVIGKVSVMPTENPFYVRSQSDLDSHLTDTTSSLYKFAVDFIANKGSTNAGIWCYAISGTAETFADLQLDGLKDAVNTTFTSPYAPIESISNVEIAAFNSGWVSVSATGYVTGTSNGLLNGSIAFTTSTGFFWSGVVQGEVSGLFVIDGIRADVSVGAMGRAFNGLFDKDWNIFTFAYDQDKSQPLDPDLTSDFKYASGQCYSASGWFNDVLVGANMATQFQAQSHAALFYAALPDGVKTTTKMTGYAVNYSGYTFPNLKQLVGNNPYFCAFVGNQTTDGVSMDNMAFSMALRDHPRPMTTYSVPTRSTQLIYPSRNEVNAWRSNSINPFIQLDNGTTKVPCIGGNYTFGLGVEGNINFIRCRDIIRNALIDDLQALVATRRLKYNIDGISAIERQIVATMQNMVNLNYCDGFVSVTIPIKPYVANEASLDSGQAAILANARATKVVNDVEVKFKWDGDAEGIIINPLTT